MSLPVVRRRRWLALLALVALLVGAGFARSRLGIDWSVESLRDWVEGLGAWGPVAFVLVFSLRLLFLIPSKLLLVAGGLCFGALAGTAYGALGITGSAVLAFALTRFAGVEWLRSQVPLRARRALEAGQTRGAAALVGVGTGYPLGPLTTWHVGAALTAMSFAAFLPAVVLGSLVRAGLYAWIGDSLAVGGWAQLGVAVALLLAAALPFLHPGVRAWVRARLAPGAAGPDASAPDGSGALGSRRRPPAPS